VVGRDSVYPMTLRSVFKSSPQLENELKSRLGKVFNIENVTGAPDDYHLYDKFVIGPDGITVLFRAGKKNENGNYQVIGMEYRWDMVKDLLDPNGPLSDKIK
jgi:hypothetical protein